MRFCLLLLCVFASSVAAKTEIVMVFGGEYQPYYNDTQSAGMFIEFLRGFNLDNPDYSIKFVPLSRRRIDVWIENGKADAFSLAHEAFVAENVRKDFLASEVIWETSDKLVSPVNKPIKFSDIQELKNLRIGTLIGNGYMDLEALFNSGVAERVDFYTIKAQFDAILMHNIDVMVINEHSILHYLDEYGFSREAIFVNDEPAYTFGLSTMVRKNKKPFLDALNRYITKSKLDDSLERISQKYRFESVPLAFSSNEQ